MTAKATNSPESYDEYKVGDTVYTLMWVGMPFEVIGKDDVRGKISLRGKFPYSLPFGALVDIFEPTLFQLTHNQWDQIWYWPDRSGETYEQVFDRFVANHHEGQIVSGYHSHLMIDPFQPEPDKAMSFRLCFTTVAPRQQIMVEPVAAVSKDGKGLLLEYDPNYPDDRWIRSGPVMPAQIEMRAYRWTLAYGPLILNWLDFDDWTLRLPANQRRAAAAAA